MKFVPLLAIALVSGQAFANEAFNKRKEQALANLTKAEENLKINKACVTKASNMEMLIKCREEAAAQREQLAAMAEKNGLKFEEKPTAKPAEGPAQSPVQAPAMKAEATKALEVQKSAEATAQDEVKKAQQQMKVPPKNPADSFKEDHKRWVQEREKDKKQP